MDNLDNVNNIFMKNENISSENTINSINNFEELTSNEFSFNSDLNINKGLSNDDFSEKSLEVSTDISRKKSEMTDTDYINKKFLDIHKILLESDFIPNNRSLNINELLNIESTQKGGYRKKRRYKLSSSSENSEVSSYSKTVKLPLNFSDTSYDSDDTPINVSDLRITSGKCPMDNSSSTTSDTNSSSPTNSYDDISDEIINELKEEDKK